MNFSHYKGLVKNEKIHRFIFAQGNRPAVEMLDGQLDYLSETFLFKEDMDSIQREISSSVDAEDKSVFFIDGKRYVHQSLELSDTAQICVYPKGSDDLSWTDLLVPGYVNDWVEARSGIVIFYGSDVHFLEKVRTLFLKRRVELTSGSSLAFSSVLKGDQVSKEGHFLTSSTDEEGFLASSASLSFDSYFFNTDINGIGGQKVLRIADKGSMVAVNSYWGDLSKVWAELSGAFSCETSRRFFFNSIIGFVGVKKADADNSQGETVLEALPMPKNKLFLEASFTEQLKKIKEAVKKDGVSFNQSLHSLVLKRKLSLDSAYKASSDPEELNFFLSESGI